MPLKRFLILVSTTTLFSWIAWGIVLYDIDPDIAGFVGLLVFYAALFFALLGTFTLLGLGLRMLLRIIQHREAIAFRYISQSIRQAIWFSLVVIGSLVLSAAQLFNWWSCGALLVGFIVLEAFFLAQQPIIHHG